jgi:L-alanine-DL-glutamate epimerase-like enolase superfamily enzyme
MERRNFIKNSAMALAFMPLTTYKSEYLADNINKIPKIQNRIYEKISSPVIIERIELIKCDAGFYVKTYAKDCEIIGIGKGTERIQYTYQMLKLIKPYLLNKDARNVVAFSDEIYLYDRNYKYAGMPFWTCYSIIEISLLDLLGKIAQIPSANFFGDTLRTQVPVYLSSTRRDTTAKEEVDWLTDSIAKCNAKAVKIKIGGRMSNNADAMPGRTEELIPLARKIWGDDFNIFVDSNGSYDIDNSIRIGKWLEDFNIGFFEEPCPWEDFQGTKTINDKLEIMIAGGEQDSSMEKFRWMLANKAIDLVQPDMFYIGGFIRCLKVARMASEYNIDITLHSPKDGPECAYMLQFASVVPNIGSFQEYRADAVVEQTHKTKEIQVVDGSVQVPMGIGLGLGNNDEIFINEVLID